MSIAIEQTIQALQVILQGVPVGTNLALLQMLWSMVNGSFLTSRGAIFPAMKASGFSEEEIRRGWAAMRHGVWRIDELLIAWRNYVQEQGCWQRHEYEGYRPVAADITAFWRMRLKGWLGRYFNGIANRLLGGVGLALVVEVGQVDGHRMPLLRKIIRAHPKEMSQDKLKAMVLEWLGRNLAANELALFDAGAHISDMQSAGVARFVIRLAKNCTARRNYLPDYKRGRPQEYGQLVRPLARKRKGKTIPASKPDKTGTFVYQGRTIQVHGWYDLVSANQKVAEQQQTFDILVFFDPLYLDPLVLATNVTLLPETVFKMYLDRWPVEQVPLVAKQTLGLGRHFVFAPESCQRLPELALLAGNILTYLAATLPPMPTGFWDRCPKKRLVGCDVSWPKLIFQRIPSRMGNFGKSGQLQTTCQRVSRLIGDENGILNRFSPFLLAF
ncbi:MAG: hypothetical protein WAM60_03980 [Candidatus Promineifilaceae bacterium]